MAVLGGGDLGLRGSRDGHLYFLGNLLVVDTNYYYVITIFNYLIV